ncbi:unnamed protein product [Musa acuminata subsp. malaccensis]|uniref:(wild Malaysian banana) hypothetical protein n=1 Tax=Musa acuminata subsp. malaccensis TaxID=214687 RepID=A0A804K1S3_MUSAM|nr:unnamed protein product [Musa acuminata subsp. malaccensis]
MNNHQLLHAIYAPNLTFIFVSSPPAQTQISTWLPLFSSWRSSCGRKRPSCSPPPPTARPALAFLVMSLLLLVLPPGEEGATGAEGRDRLLRSTAASMRSRRIPPRRRSPWNPFGFRLLVPSDGGCKWWLVSLIFECRVAL